MHSEKLLDMIFTDGKLTRVANQFGNGLTGFGLSSGSAGAN